MYIHLYSVYSQIWILRLGERCYVSLPFPNTLYFYCEECQSKPKRCSHVYEKVMTLAIS